MILTIDHREQRSGIVTLAEKILEIEVVVKTLDFGDYCINNRIVFERKTLPDFLGSIKSGHFFRQSYRLINRNTPYILILEGVRDDIQVSQMRREAVQGALVHISVFLGIPILRSHSIEETLQLMIMAGRQLERYDENFEHRIYNHNVKAKKSNKKKQKLQILQNLPGVGRKRAEAILNGYGSLNKFFLTNIDKLTEIEGIGNRTASAIIKLIHDEQQKVL